MPFMRSPAELGRLRAFADKAVDRPGVDEFARFFRYRRYLRVALGDVVDLEAEPLGETSPIAAAGRFPAAEIRTLRDVDQRPLDEMRDEARVGAVRQNSGRPPRVAEAKRERALAQRVIRARRWRQAGIGIAARPWLDAGIQIQRASFLTELDQSDARDIDRDVEEKIAVTELRLQQGPVIAPGQSGVDKADAILGRDILATRLGGNDGNL